MPIVLLDAPGDPFWRHIDDFVHTQLIARGLVNEADSHLYLVTDSSDAACAEIEHFYANFDSIRYVGNQAVIRLRHAPTDEQLALLDQRFAAIVASGHIERSGALPIEVRQRRPHRPPADPLRVRPAPLQRPAGHDRSRQLVHSSEPSR